MSRERSTDASTTDAAAPDADTTYAVTVTRTFVARHVLTVPDPGPEGELHAHRYEAEVTLRGPTLDEHGYLVDIDDVRSALSAVEGRYDGATLNDLPEFEGRNPSTERLARAVRERVVASADLAGSGVEHVRVIIWEDEDAAAACAGPV